MSRSRSPRSGAGALLVRPLFAAIRPPGLLSRPRPNPVPVPIPILLPLGSGRQAQQSLFAAGPNGGLGPYGRDGTTRRGGAR